MKSSILFVALALIGCGSSTTGGTGGGSGTGGGTAASGGGTGTGGGTQGTGGGSGGATTGFGLVRVQQTATGSGVVRSAVATFYSNGAPVMAPGTALFCVKTQSGACAIEDCSQDGGTVLFDGGLKTSAGTVTVDVPPDAGATLGYLEASGIYTGQNLPLGQWWDGGETIAVNGTGSTDGGAPAFAATLKAPTLLVITSPSPDAGSVTVTKNMPFTFSWAPGVGSVQIQLQTGSTTAHSLTALCTADASAGTFTIPAAVTNQMVSTNAGFLSITNQATGAVTSGTYAIQATALSASKTWTATVP